MERKRERLARIAEEQARRPFHGKTMGLRSNLKPLIDHFPRGPRGERIRLALVFGPILRAGQVRRSAAGMGLLINGNPPVAAPPRRFSE